MCSKSELFFSLLTDFKMFNYSNLQFSGDLWACTTSYMWTVLHWEQRGSREVKISMCNTRSNRIMPSSSCRQHCVNL